METYTIERRRPFSDVPGVTRGFVGFRFALAAAGAWQRNTRLPHADYRIIRERDGRVMAYRTIRSGQPRPWVYCPAPDVLARACISQLIVAGAYRTDYARKSGMLRRHVAEAKRAGMPL